MLTELPSLIRFKLVAEPGENEPIGLSLVGYISGKDGSSGFLRKRLELLLEGGASALETDPEKSSWEFDPAPRFVLVADFDRTATKRYNRTITYLPDDSGVAREFFPMLIRYRASWAAIFDEI